MTANWIDLTGRVAVVTGAASGIGRASALGLGEVGATVIALDRDEAGAQVVAERIPGAHARGLDVTSDAGWRDIADWIEADFGRLDILVNCAGIAPVDSVGDDDLEVYRRTFAVNVEGSLLGMRTALGFMRRTGKGAIVNIASVASMRGGAIMASYGASKAAIANYTRSAALAAIEAGQDIRVNSIHPGVIDTAMGEEFCGIYSHLGSREEVEKFMTTGRFGRPEEVADLVVYLCSDRASFISGTGILIDRAANA